MSKVSYDNTPWLIEFFGHLLGVDYQRLGLRYEGDNPEDPSDDILVWHPGDKLYWPEAGKCRQKSPELKRYEHFAKKSARLKEYEENSPAEIKYFNDLCDI